MPLMSQAEKFEILGHTADIRLRAYGKDKQGLFQNALLGMITILRPLEVSVRLRVRKIEIKAIDENALLVDFLNEALYFAQTQNEAYESSSFKKLTKTYLAASLRGRKVNGFEKEVKGISYQGVEIKQKKGRWEATIILDV